MSSTAASRKGKRGLPRKVRMRHEAHFVEELGTRSETPVGRMLALASIEPDARQPRETLGSLDELVASIREKGVLEPVLVRRSSDDENAYVLISGERRYRAALEAGLFEIPAIEMDVSDQEALEIALIENLQRKDLTPFEEAEGYFVLAERHRYTHDEIARAVGKSRVSITEALSLRQMPAEVRDAVLALGVTSKSILLEVLKVGDAEEMIRLLERVSSLGLNRDAVRREVKQATPKKPARRKPYTFQFRAPDKSYKLSLSFRQSEVDHDDLILALEEILGELRELRDR